MALLTAAQAKSLVLVDPKTSLQIEHVKACDPEKCYYEYWYTIPCEPGFETIIQKADGTTETRDWTPVKMTLGDGTGAEYMWKTCKGVDFDVVDKYTGEVIYEARCELLEDDEEPVSDPLVMTSEYLRSLAPTAYDMVQMDKLLEECDGPSK